MCNLHVVLLLVYLSNIHGASKPPHVILILSDDIGYNDVPWTNKDIHAPNLEKLARNGVILNSSYVQPLCTPSRSSLLGGLYPFHVGLQHSVILPTSPKYLPANLTLFPEKLQDAGYATHMVGKWHLGFCNWKYTPTYRGFDSFLGFYNWGEDYYTHLVGQGDVEGYDFRFNESVYYPEEGEYSTTTFAKRAVEIISSHNKDDKPLFLYLAFQTAHTPLQVEEKYLKRYRHIKDEKRRTFSGMVTAMDDAVGQIMKSLKQNGYMDNLLLIFTSDNGGGVNVGGNNWPLRGSKFTLWEGGTRGAGFVYSKTLLEKTGYVNSELMHIVDWYPTILHVAGGTTDDDIDGVNQWDTISKGSPSPRTKFVYNIDDVDQSYAIRDGDYKLIVGNPSPQHQKFNDWYPPWLSSFEQSDVSYTNRVQLFNIKDDPTEHFDIAVPFQEVVETMLEQLETYKESMALSFSPPSDPGSYPENFGGIWSPGWC